MRLLGTIYTNLSIIEREFDVDFTFDDLLEFFTPIHGEKESLLQWNAASFREGATERHKKDITHGHAIILDKDCGDIGEYADCLEHLTQSGFAFFMHSSHSHRVVDKLHKGTGLLGTYDCFRVILPTSRPVTQTEFSTVAKAVLTYVVKPDPSRYLQEAEDVSSGKKVTKATGKPPKPRGWDPACGSISQFWYGPGCPIDRIDDILFDVVQGKPLDVDWLLSKAPVGKFSARRNRKVEKLDGQTDGLASSKIGRTFERVARSLESKGCPLDKEELGEECRSQCPVCHAGKDSLCIKSEENTILMTCFASCETADILKELGLSFADLDGGKAEVEERSIQRAFNSDRTEPYTKSELAAMAPIEERWILQTSAGYFIRGPGGDYTGPIARDHVVNKARDILAPANSAGVSLFKTTAKAGCVDKNLGELMREYGQTPTNVQYSYCAGKSYLDGDVFVQKTAVMEVWPAERCIKIEKWLELFAGDRLPGLLDWLATLWDLSRPTCAVCVAGASGAGKDLFVEGIARMWGGKSTSFQRAISRFNDALLGSPLVVANEQLVGTGDYQWNPVEALKTMVTDTQRTIEAKNVKGALLDGALRVILATNNNGALDLGRQPTQSDLAALDERILLIEPGVESAAYLIDIGGMDTTIDWVRGGAMARHISWLRETRTVKYGTRFIVRGTGGMSDLLASESSGGKAVLKAVLNALCGKQKDEKVCCVKGRDVWLSRSNLMEKWAMLERSDRPDGIGEILATVSTNERKAIWVGNKVIKMRKLQIGPLKALAEREDMLEELEEALKHEVVGGQN